MGVIGTLGAFVGEREIKYSGPKLTTPDAEQLREIFAQMIDLGVKTVVMEVSAHGIAQGRVRDLTFRVGVLTNITQDHLDYFKTFEAYEQTKLGWFNGESVQVGIRATVRPNFMESNREVCAQVAREMGVSERVIRRRVRSLEPVSGRFNILAIKKNKAVIIDYDRAKRGHMRLPLVVIDYAHTPDGLEKVLGMAREITKGRLISVFGCGGNRDTTKREIMGKISAELADFTVITSDNPRNESPKVIMLQIEAGVKAGESGVFVGGKGAVLGSGRHVLVEDRREATEFAIEMARAGDVVVIAGKGAETTQEIAGVFHPYVDADVVRDILRAKRR